MTVQYEDGRPVEITYESGHTGISDCDVTNHLCKSYLEDRRPGETFDQWYDRLMTQHIWLETGVNDIDRGPAEIVEKLNDCSRNGMGLFEALDAMDNNFLPPRYDHPGYQIWTSIWEATKGCVEIYRTLIRWSMPIYGRILHQMIPYVGMSLLAMFFTTAIVNAPMVNGIDIAKCFLVMLIPSYVCVWIVESWTNHIIDTTSHTGAQ